MITYGASSSLRVQANSAELRLAPLLEIEIERRWQESRRSNPALFNGTVFSVDTLSKDNIDGHWTEFRVALAQVQEPSLHSALSIRPLAACGLLVCSFSSDEEPGSAVFLGQRNPASVFHPGKWQLVPAGSIDAPATKGQTGAVDWRRQILSELFEEVGLTPDRICSVKPLCIIDNPRTHGVELGIVLQCTASVSEVVELQQECGNDEYVQLRPIRIQHIPLALSELGHTVVAPSRAFLDRYWSDHVLSQDVTPDRPLRRTEEESRSST